MTTKTNLVVGCNHDLGSIASCHLPQHLCHTPAVIKQVTDHCHQRICLVLTQDQL